MIHTIHTECDACLEHIELKVKITVGDIALGMVDKILIAARRDTTCYKCRRAKRIIEEKKAKEWIKKRDKILSEEKLR